MKTRDDIFRQQYTISNGAINIMGKDMVVDGVFDEYFRSIKSSVKQLVTTTTEDDSSTDSTVVEMKLAILDTQEYRRLKEIEKQYLEDKTNDTYSN